MKRLLFALFILFLTVSTAFSTIMIRRGEVVDSSVIFSDGDGFESPWSPTSNAGNWDSFYGSPVSEGSIVAVGSVSMECSATARFMVKDISDYTEVWFDYWIYTDTLTGDTDVFRIKDSGGTNYIDGKINDPTDIYELIDGTTTWSSGVEIVDDTWYHVFVHLIYTTGGSETVQICITTSTFDAWDYSTTSATIVPTNASNLNIGTWYSPGSDVLYYDSFKIYEGTEAPPSW